MNIEQTLEAIRIMQAYVDGKEVEFKNRHHLTNALPLWVPVPSPVWNWVDDIKSFRIKPTATLRPWTADEVPVGAILRYKGNPRSIRFLIASCLEQGLAGYETHWPYQALLQEMEHSTDGGKTWLPCGVVEESK